MADTVSKTSNDPFLSQAQVHRNFADHTRQMIGQYQTIHNNLMDATQSSCISDNAMQHYADWWQTFQSNLSNKADLHEQMANHLEQTANGFDETDSNIQQTFSGNTPGSSS